LLLEHNKNNSLEDNKRNIDRKAAFWTTVTMAIILALLFLFGFKTLHQEESGMLINFGDSETGTGHIEPAKNDPAPKITPPPKPQVESPSAAQEELETQNFEEAAAIEAAKKKEKKRKVKEDKERQEALERQREIERLEEIERQKELEKERIRKEDERRIEEERKAREAKAEAIRQQTSNAFGQSNNNSEGQGITKGEGNQGGANGSINSNNYSGNGLGTSGDWSLAGRSLMGSLPKPRFSIQKEGKVAVEIHVDREGNVISATPILKGSTTQDAQLYQLAKEAALKAKFNANPGAKAKQVGTITYRFVLN
jgi:colicin import membrane protein